ncbi:MAG: GtrA family protein [Muribaculaceae bacterium]|nr:GtrA family protein [Muribaculaceae bacterium]MDE6130069.1 GtrA family protein [Muribaculaceae bacterium]
MSEPTKDEIEGGKNLLRRTGDKLLNSNSLFTTFLRSVVSSQTASWVDLGLCFVLFAWVGMTAWSSTALGAVAGGVVNCIINYKFTFHADGCSWRAVVVKYTLVWLGSLALNTFGTQLLYDLIKDWDWLQDIGFKKDGYFAAARLFVSLLVSWCWNFVLQRNFVYRRSRFDRHAIALVNFVTRHKDEAPYDHRLDRL